MQYRMEGRSQSSWKVLAIAKAANGVLSRGGIVRDFSRNFHPARVVGNVELRWDNARRLRY